MFKNLSAWYKKLPPPKQLAMSLLLNWIYWLVAWLIAERFFFDEKYSWSYHIFHATWMSLFMTTISNFKRVKALFRSGRKKTGINL